MTSNRTLISDELGLWLQQAKRERHAAALGGDYWREFVAQCQSLLRRPWSEIRVEFDRLHRAGFTSS